jgi:uncharacterized protein Smg (DUF494 family)
MVSGRNKEERIREIISWIIENDHDDLLDAVSLHNRLEEQGYSTEEIDRAFTLLEVDSTGSDLIINDGFDIGSRVFSPSERKMLSLEAQGWLLWLRSAGYITETQLSLVIESAGLEFRPPASLVEVMEIASRYVSSIPVEMEKDRKSGIN